jgi:hypothetical protein
MKSKNKELIRRIVREELHAYETKLIDFTSKDCIVGLANRDEIYKKFIADVLLNNNKVGQTDEISINVSNKE